MNNIVIAINNLFSFHNKKKIMLYDYQSSNYKSFNFDAGK